MIEEHVNKLAFWQAERKIAEDAVNNDQEVINLNNVIAALEAEMAEAHKTLVFLRAGYDTRISEINDEIKHVSTQIIDEWTGEKKTMPFDAGTLKFTSRGSLKIHDEGWLLNDILDRISVEDLIKNKYLKGFNLTAVKKYMSVHELPVDVAEIEYTTTVKLEQKT